MSRGSNSSNNLFRRPLNCIVFILSFTIVLYLYVFLAYFRINQVSSPTPLPTASSKPYPSNPKLRIKNEADASLSQPIIKKKSLEFNSSTGDLNDIVTAIIECQTSHGNLIIDIRENWSPYGARRYMELIERGLFTNSPFFRVCPRYITQFGVKYGWKGGLGNIPDDPSLWGKRDMNFGYLFFAGSGRNSRNDQMVISLCQTEACKLTTLGKTPWEVPIGTIRRSGFNTLVNIEKTGFPYPSLEMDGLAPNAGGPNQGLIRSNPNYLKESYPHMAYWEKCEIKQSGISLIRELSRDHNLDTESYPFNISRYSKNLVMSPAINDQTSPLYVEFLIVLNGNNVKNEPSINLPRRIVLEIIPAWAPLGAKRFIELVETLYFDNAAFFRVIKGFMAQFGIAAIPSTGSYWRSKPIKDDPVVESNARGTISFATSGPNTRTSQLFINFVNNKYLDKQGFTPIGRVIEGMETVVDHLYYHYGEGGQGDGADGKGPSQGRLNLEGKKYLDKTFPKLSYIKYATVLEGYHPEGGSS